MILNALDEVLFWEDIETLKQFTKENSRKFYPHDYENYYKNAKNFFRTVIPSKAEFIHRLETYADIGQPIWISGRNELSDDIDAEAMVKAISVSSKISNGKEKAARASKWRENNPSFWNFYTDNILHQQENKILELTVGAGGGTTAVMQKMTEQDYYMGVDIDFGCAKNADALAKYYNINGLGIATSLWRLPFDDCMFTSVCCNAGLEECREVPTIIKEAYRVLKPGGKITLHCVNTNKIQSYPRFEEYGFSEEEMIFWLKQIRMFASIESLEELLTHCGFKLFKKMTDERLGSILVFEK